MAQAFSYEFSTSGTPEEAQARLARVITERLRRPTDRGAASNAQHQMRLSKQKASSLSYKPKLVIPLPVSLSVWLGRLIRGEKVDVHFAPNGSDGQTRVVVSGNVGRGAQALADREFWTETLSAK
jgi:hypothetical protein